VLSCLWGTIGIGPMRFDAVEAVSWVPAHLDTIDGVGANAGTRWGASDDAGDCTQSEHAGHVVSGVSTRQVVFWGDGDPLGPMNGCMGFYAIRMHGVYGFDA